MINFQAMNDMIKRNNQKNIDSDLWKSIKQVLNCDTATAQKYASTHCNLFSFWINLYFQEFIQMQYADFFNWGLHTLFNNEPAWLEPGFIKPEKQDILNFFRDDLEIIKFKDFDSIPDRADGQLYQVHILNKDNATHFLTGYIDNGSVLISDSSYRGCGVPINKALATDHIVWVKRIQVRI